MKTIETLDPKAFRGLITTIGELPSSFVDSMSYYEMIAWLVDYIKNNVIPAVNNNAEAIKEIQKWIETLDLQDEVDNKLDEMAASGQLAEIISQYLNSAAIFGYDNVASMKSAENLVSGSYARTLGYYAKNDGGGALYKIRNVTNDDVVDEGFIVEITADPQNNLVAELIVEDKVNVTKLGAYGDGTHDDTAKLSSAIAYCLANDKTLTSESGKTYLISTTLSTDNCCIDFNNSTITTNSAIDLITIQNTFSAENANTLYTIKNLKLDLNSIATSGINMKKAIKCNLDHIEMLNVTTKGLIFETGYEVNFHDSDINGNENSTSAIGIELKSSDSVFTDLVIVDCNVAIKAYSVSNVLTRVHPWILHTAVLTNSKFIECAGSCALTLTDCNADTFQYVIYQGDSANTPQINCKGLTVFYNNNIYNHETNNHDSYIVYASNVANCRYIIIENSYLKGLNDANIHTYMCNDTAFVGNLSNNMYWNMTNNVANALTSIASGLTTITNKIIKNGDMVEINGLFSYDASATSGQVSVGSISNGLKPQNPINATCQITDAQWNPTTFTTALMYIEDGVQVKLPVSITSGTHYIHLNIVYKQKQ